MACKALNYVIHLLILTQVVIGFVSISVFPCFDGIPVCFANSAVGLEICAKIVRIKRFKSVIKDQKEEA